MSRPQPSPKDADWYACPGCGAEVRVGSRGCPQCSGKSWEQDEYLDGLDLPPEGIALEAVGDPAAAPVQERRLREDIRALPAAGQGAADDLLRVPEPVHGRRVDPVDTEVTGQSLELEI